MLSAMVTPIFNFCRLPNTRLCPHQLTTSPITNLSYPITTLVDCKSSNLIYHSNVKNVKLFTLGKQVRCSLNLLMGTIPLARPWTPRYHPRPCPPPTWNCVSTHFRIPPIPGYLRPITSLDLPSLTSRPSPSVTC